MRKAMRSMGVGSGVFGAFSANLRLSRKVLFLMPICSCLPMIAGAADMVPGDIVPPPIFLIPPPDTITPYVGLGLTYDDNVLRLPNAAASEALGAGGNLSDMTRTAQVGLALNEKISQQQITANMSVAKINYDRFSQLDHLDKNLAANWNWHLGPYVEGNAGLTYSQGLTPFIDFHLLQANIRKQQTQYVDGSWLFHPSWRVYAGLTHSKLAYDLASQQTGNNTQYQTKAGIDYIAHSGSTIGLQARHTSANFPNPEMSGGQLVFNGYTQNELKAKIDWLLTGKTRLHFLGGWVSRKQDTFQQRNFSGMNSRLSADWSPTGKVDVSASIWREIGAVDELSTVYSLNHGASLAASWQYSEKTRFIAQTNYQKRDFTQSSASGTIPSGSTSQKDTLRNTGLTMVYTPVQRWELRLSGVRSTQSSSNGGYVSNAVLFNTRYMF